MSMIKKNLLTTVNISYDQLKILISIEPKQYENTYLWKILMYDILFNLIDDNEIGIQFFDTEIYWIFLDLIDFKYIKNKNDDERNVMISSCNKRIITELLSGYSFFDYSDIMRINVFESINTKRCTIVPTGDWLGIEITNCGDITNIVKSIKKVCLDYGLCIKGDEESE